MALSSLLSDVIMSAGVGVSPVEFSPVELSPFEAGLAFFRMFLSVAGLVLGRFVVFWLGLRTDFSGFLFFGFSRPSSRVLTELKKKIDKQIWLVIRRGYRNSLRGMRDFKQGKLCKKGKKGDFLLKLSI